MKQYAKMTVSGAVVCTAKNKKEAALKLCCKLSEVYIYSLGKGEAK